MTNEELLKELQKLGYNDFIVPAGEYEVAAEVGDEGGAVKLAKDGRLIKKAKNLKSMPEIINKVKQYVEEGGSGLKTNNKAFLNSAELSEEKFVQELVSKYFPILKEKVYLYGLMSQYRNLEAIYKSLGAFWPTILLEFKKFQSAKNIQTLRDMIEYCRKQMLKRKAERPAEVAKFLSHYRAGLEEKYDKHDKIEARDLEDEYDAMAVTVGRYNQGVGILIYYFDEMEKKMDDFKKRNG